MIVRETSDLVMDLMAKSAAAPRIGTVHSLYRRTINLDFQGTLISIQSEGSPVSPISLILPCRAEELATFPCAVGTPCRMEASCIHLGDMTLSLSDSTGVYTSTLSGNAPDSHLAEGLRLILRAAPGGFAPLVLGNPASESDLIACAAETNLQRADAAFAAEDYEESARALTRLLGLGIGLTPSGDDFLCGLLALSSFAGGRHSTFARTLREKVRERPEDTNRISRAFLQCALEGHYSRAITRLFSDAARSPEALALHHAEDFLAIGHTSGMDTLAGILWGVARIF